MPRETAATRRSRVRRILDILARTYPDAHCELTYSNPLELLVATILSAQCSDRQVNLVTPALFAKYRSAADYASAPRSQLEADVKRIGLFRTKSRNLQECCAMLVARHQGRVPDRIEDLVALSGVGRKTANVVLGNAYGIQAGVVVDTHVARLSARLGLSTGRTAVAVENDLMRLVPRDDWAVLSHRLIWHGRRRCRARNPDCAGCELRELCPARVLRNLQGPRRPG